MAGRSVGRINLDMFVNNKSMQKQLSTSGMKKSVSGMFRKLGLIAGAAFSANAFGTFAKESISLASELEEIRNVVNVVFGESAKRIDEFAKSSMTSLGLSELQVKKFTGNIGAMFRSAGLAGDEVLDMSIKTAELVGDFASFYDMPHEEVFEMIRAGITGITMPLKKVGINMNQTNLEAFAMESSLNKAFKEMSEAEKTILRFEYLLKASSFAQGDFARTADSWANQVRVMSLRWKEFKTDFGTGLIPLFTPVLKFLNSMIAKMSVLAKQFSAFMQAFFGVKKASTSAEKAISTLSDGFDNAAESQGNLTESAKEAAKEAAKASLASFDKLNIVGNLPDSSSGSSGSSGSSADTSASSEGDLLDTFDAEATEEKAEILAAALKRGFVKIGEEFKQFYETYLKEPATQLYNFFEDTVKKNVIDSWNNIYDSLKPVVTKIGDLFEDVIIDYFTSFSENIGGIIDEVSVFLDNLFYIFDETVSLLSGILEDFVDDAALWWDEWGKGLLDKSWRWLEDVYNTVNVFFEEWLKPIFDDGLAWIQRMWDEHLRGIFVSIGEFVGTVTNLLLDLWHYVLKPIIDWLIKYVGPLVRTLFNNAMNFFGVVFSFIGGLIESIVRILKGLLQFLAGVFTGDWETTWNGIKEIIGGVKDFVWNFVQTAIDTLNLFYNSIKDLLSAGFNQIKIIFGPLISWFSNLWDSITNKIDSFSRSISAKFLIMKINVQNKVRPLISWFRGVWDDIKSIFSNVSDWFSGIFTGAKEAIVNVFDSLKDAIKRPINKIIDSINNLISKMNGLSIKMPAVLGGGTLGFNIPKISSLAEGGIVSQPTLAMVGDNNRSSEVVAPLHKLNDMLMNANSNASSAEMTNLLTMILQVLKTLNMSTEVYIGDEKIEDIIEKRKQRRILRSGRIAEVRA